MEDLNLTMNLLTTSSKLEKAGVSLGKLASGESLNQSDKDILSWAGNFLLAMDWGAQGDTEPQIGGCLAVQATSIRPTFYSCLFRIAPNLKEAGILNQQDLSSFLINFYRNLTHPGSPGRGYKRLKKTESNLGILLLQKLAESILVQINNNGLPKTPASIKDDWQPTYKDNVTLSAF